jgi:peptidoglycan-associated lipoprotein
MTGLGIRVAALCALLGLAGCVGTSEPRVVARGPVGDVTNAPAGAGVNVRDGSPEDFIVNVGRRIYFAQGSANLDDTAQETLNNQAAWLGTYKRYPVKVDGFADDPGSAAENMKLGLRRAEAAKAYLVARGIDASRIRVRSSGNTRPTMRCADISCKAQNRHVRTVLDTPTQGGQQPADVPLDGAAAPDAQAARRPAAGVADGVIISGRVAAEGVVARR